MTPSRLTGSKNVTELKARVKKHTVSYTMLFDESIWNQYEKSPKNESYVELDNLTSPLFSAEDDGEVLFKVMLSKLPPEDRRVKSASTSVYQIHVILESKPLPMTVHFDSLYQSDLEGPFLSLEENEKYFSTVQPNHTTAGHAYNEDDTFVKRGVKGFRIDVSYVTVLQQVDRQSTPVTSKNMVLPKRSIGSDMAYLLENPVASDVIIKGGDREWNLHKCVLSARSDVFAAMFASDMRENKIGVVQIKDVHASVLDLMIRFIYKDIDIDIDAVDQNTAEELLILSDKYALPVLQELCENRLISLLSIENCLRLCAFASKHNSQLLLTPAKTMLANNSVIICRRQTTEYKDFLKENSDLYVDMLLTKEPSSDK